MKNKLPKILVTSGCSYGLFGLAFGNHVTKEISNSTFYNNLELVLDYHSQSLGSRFQSISIIESVDKLLSIGVKPYEIFVICEFSEISRNDIVIQNDFLVSQINNTKVERVINGVREMSELVTYPSIKTLKANEYTENIVSNIVVNKFFASDYAKFNNYYVINPEKRFQPKFPNNIIQSLLNVYVSSMNIDTLSVLIDRINVEYINRAINYFQNILTTENYLKSKGVEYKFCLINNQFSMYNENGLQEVKKTKKINGEHYLCQNYVNSKQIWEINSMVKILYEMIDWSKWWFYENKDKNIIWGGIDEYAIDKYGVSCYDSKTTDNNLFGEHPNVYVYTDLLKNEILKEELAEENYKLI